MDAPDFRIDGKVALITGAGRGIGVGIAQAMAASGAAVAIQDIDLDVARAEAKKIADAGGRAFALGGDLTDLSIARRLVDETVAQLGGLHILVNNGAIQKQIHWTELSPEEIEQKFRANIIVPLLLCQAALPHMRAGKYGRIINVGSVQSRRGNPGMLHYSMTKAALVNMTTALSRDLAKEGITVNLLAPGYFNTYRNREDFKDPKETNERVKNWIPLGRAGEPRDVGGIAVTLASLAGEYITGQTIFVDGGM